MTSVFARLAACFKEPNKGPFATDIHDLWESIDNLETTWKNYIKEYGVDVHLKIAHQGLPWLVILAAIKDLNERVK